MSLLGNLKIRMLGIIFLCLLLVGVWLTYALFAKKFTHYDRVTLLTDRVGLQLPDRADVKIRGVLVGEVLAQKATATGASLTLGLYPSQLDSIPSDVTGAILPKTLFGEKYVSLEAPSDQTSSSGAATSHIEPGAVIHKTHVAIEVEKVLSDIYPLLNTIQPADLNETLNAVATALEGRGAKLGSTIETLDHYLKRINPQVPRLVNDIKMAAKVSDTYNAALPEIADILRNSITTATTLQDHATELRSLLTNVTAFSQVGNQFLADNGDNLIELGNVTEPVVRMLARYSPEFPCLLGGLDNLTPRVADAFRNFTLHITLETLPRQPRTYTTKDKPRYGDDRGPACGHLPNPPWSQSNPLKVVPNLNDGVDEPTGKGTDRAPVDFGGMSYAGTPAETSVIDQLLAPGLGVSAKQVPDLGALLVGPLARGAKVGLQ